MKKYKCEVIIDEKDLARFEEFCCWELGILLEPTEMTETTISPKPVGHPSIDVDKEHFIACYCEYMYNAISKEDLLIKLGINKTKFHQTLRTLRNDGLLLPSKSEIKRYDAFKLAYPPDGYL